MLIVLVFKLTSERESAGDAKKSLVPDFPISITAWLSVLKGTRGNATIWKRIIDRENMCNKGYKTKRGMEIKRRLKAVRY